jgi:hypothetical protein
MIKNKEINLGTMNGWGSATREQYAELQKHMVEGSNDSRSIGRCYTEYKFTADIDGEKCTVIYKVDSGG